jgi:hypothetical protein
VLASSSSAHPARVRPHRHLDRRRPHPRLAAFWLVQTKELWDVVDRRTRPNTADPTGPEPSPRGAGRPVGMPRAPPPPSGPGRMTA